MANIAISELETEATVLNNDDLLLVSKKNGTSFTSAKMKAGVVSDMISDSSSGVLSAVNENSDIILDIKANISEIKTILNTHTEYLSNLTNDIAKIGNKVYGLSGGEIGDTEFTVTLTTSGTGTPSQQPTGGEKYKSGTHAVLTAYDPTDTYYYQFIGWYIGDALQSTQKIYAPEVTSNVTYTAKYAAKNVSVQAKLTVINNSDYDIGFEASSFWIDMISKKTTGTYETGYTLTYNKDSGWVEDNITFYSAKSPTDKSRISPVPFKITANSNARIGTEYNASIPVYASGTPPIGTIECSVTITNK